MSECAAHWADLSRFPFYRALGTRATQIYFHSRAPTTNGILLYANVDVTTAASTYVHLFLRVNHKAVANHISIDWPLPTISFCNIPYCHNIGSNAVKISCVISIYTWKLCSQFPADSNTILLQNKFLFYQIHIAKYLNNYCSIG